MALTENDLAVIWKLYTTTLTFQTLGWAVLTRSYHGPALCVFQVLPQDMGQPKDYRNKHHQVKTTFDRRIKRLSQNDFPTKWFTHFIRAIKSYLSVDIWRMQIDGLKKTRTIREWAHDDSQTKTHFAQTQNKHFLS